MRPHAIAGSLLLLLLLAGLASPSHALPPGAAQRGLRDGVNHRVGDDSFVARFGRSPRDGTDGEALRMHTHLAYVRERLASRPATRPELAATRAQLLAYLDDYIAKGTTPINTRLPWRSPVFIDEHGTICAVGYLIERSAGRALPERIAAAHRHDFLEDIAADMPEVRAWIASSGFTADELASIQPAYEGIDLPNAEQWVPWTLSRVINNGEYAERGFRGKFRRGHMHGAWTGESIDDPETVKVTGRGTFVNGAGTWRSNYPDGSKLAEGPYVASVPHGAWRFYHPSGRLAAEGQFVAGRREGPWTFFYDTAARAPIAVGQFSNRAFAGRWHHFDESGKIIAILADDTPERWAKSGRGRLLTITAGADKVEHRIHLGSPGFAQSVRMMESLALDGERLYLVEVPVYPVSTVMFDGDGNKLTVDRGTWYASDCGWSPLRKRIARRGDLSFLHGLLTPRGEDDPEPAAAACAAPVAIAAERGKKLDAMLASLSAIRTPSADFVKRFTHHDFDKPEDTLRQQDLAKVIADGVARHVDWPHINGLFDAVFETLPGEIPYMDNQL